jgi:formylglycine-generating enzyme required for sulfatase activity
MKARAFFSALCVAFLAVGCRQFNNPTDPFSSSYPGYPVVALIGEVTPSLPPSGGESWFPLFTCAKCGKADLYGLRISTSQTAFDDNVIFEKQGFADNARMAVPGSVSLAADTPYYWRSCAREKSTGKWGAWSDVVFTVRFTGVAGSEVNPENGGTANEARPLLRWKGVQGAAGYYVQLGSSAEALSSAALTSAAVSEYRLPAVLSPGDKLYWRVQPVNAEGVHGVWSGPFFFSKSLMTMVMVPGGTFEMGSSTGDPGEKPPHGVTLSDFFIGTSEVTQSQYRQVMGSNPSYFSDGSDAPNRPVEQVSWHDAVAFCNALSEREGLQKVYEIDGADVTEGSGAGGYRLPTEAEWEFAALGGLAGGGHSFSGGDDPEAVAWYSSNSGGTTHAVGTAIGNELEVFDMSGNVAEWCWDWNGDYPSWPQTDPRGPSDGTCGVVRGGAWNGLAWHLRPMYRDISTVRDSRLSTLGFRVIRNGE